MQYKDHSISSHITATHRAEKPSHPSNLDLVKTRLPSLESVNPYSPISQSSNVSNLFIHACVHDYIYMYMYMYNCETPS